MNTTDMIAIFGSVAIAAAFGGLSAATDSRMARGCFVALSVAFSLLVLISAIEVGALPHQ